MECQIEFHDSDDWESEFMTIFVTWQLRMTLDRIRNSCDVFFPHIPLWFLWYLRYFCLILHISAVVGSTVPQCLGLVRSLALPAGIGTTSYKYGTKRRYWQVLAQSFVAKSLLAQKLGIDSWPVDTGVSQKLTCTYQPDNHHGNIKTWITWLGD